MPHITILRCVFFVLGLTIHYDHHEFPGVVPRSFSGAIVLGLLTKPLQLLADNFGFDKFVSQYLARAVLGLSIVASLSHMRRSFERTLGKDVGFYFILMFCVQFHLPFYFSRTLPNIFALFLTNLALSYWIRQKYDKVISLLAFSAVVLRSEILVFGGCIGLVLLCQGKIKFEASLFLATSSVLLSLVPLDSFFWQRWIWPEAEVLYYNTVLNKSHNWGTSPFYWYFLIAIPKTLLATSIFVPLGIYFDYKLKKGISHLLLPALAFVGLYSLLPHKELRFIFYIFPIFNLVSAFGISSLLSKSKYRGFVKFLVYGIILASAVASVGFLYISSSNYPGGVAFSRLHKLETKHSEVRVHIDVAAAMTGVSRFGQLRPDWIYDKTEDIQDYNEYLKYTHVIHGNTTLLDALKPNFEVLEVIEGYDSLQKYPPRVKLAPKIWIMRNTKCSSG